MATSETQRVGPNHRSPAVSEEAVRWAYRLFLDRDPENQQAVDGKLRLADVSALRTSFLQSEEFRRRNAQSLVSSVAARSDRRPLDVDVKLGRRDLAKLLALTTDTWTALGSSDPYWSVLSDDRYRSGAVAESLKDFHDSGRRQLARSLRLIRSNGVDPRSLRVVVEYGCGVGRVTRWLAEEFEEVYAYDISPSHLELANRYLRDVTTHRVELRRISSVDELTSLPTADLVYTFLVLQHNPPPVIAFTLRHLLSCLAPRGVALFQLPTYAPGYSFSYSRYMSSRRARGNDAPAIEMHLLPQHRVHEIIHEAGCELLEVLEDGSAGAGFTSNTFLVRRRTQ